MNKAKFNETQKKLYNYFERESKIASLRYKIEIIKNQISRIEKEKMDYNGYRSPNWDEKVQTSSSGSSYAESEMIRHEEGKKLRIGNCIKEIEEIKETILQIERDNAVIDYNLRYLNAEIMDLLRMKYRDRKSETAIGLALNLDQSAVNKRKEKIIQDIARWEEWSI